MKKCPYCAEQIQDEAIKCRYCGSMLNGAAAPPPAGSRTADALHGEVRALLAQREKIAAIKLVRQRTGTGLREAKSYVEALETGQVPAVPTSAPAAATSGAAGGSLARAAMFIGMLATALALYFLFAHRR